MSAAPGSEERLRELATGFALGELSDAELAELHGLLTADPDAACVAWETLGTVTDLRAHLGGPVFAEAVRLKIAASGRFERNARRRLGLRRGLDPVEAPEAPPRRRLPWIIASAVLGLVVLSGLGLALRPRPPARVDGILGQVRAGGQVVAPGASLDGSVPLAVPGGAAVRIVWRDGSAAVIAGPAGAVAQPGGLSLVTGEAWVVAGGSGLVLGLPDRRLELPAGGRAAVAVQDEVGMVALPSGTPAALGGPPPGQVVAGPTLWPWRPAQDASGGAVALPGPDWRLEAGIGPWTADGAVHLRLSPGMTIRLAPGELALLPEGRPAPQPVRLSGAPLAPHRLHLRLRANTLRVLIDDSEVATGELAAAPTALTIEAQAAQVTARLISGPDQTPPLPLPGW